MQEERLSSFQHFSGDQDKIWRMVRLTGEVEQALLKAALNGKLDTVEYNVMFWANGVRDTFLEDMKHPFLRIVKGQVPQRDDNYMVLRRPSFPDYKTFEHLTYFRSKLSGLYLKSYTPKEEYKSIYQSDSAISPLSLIGVSHLPRDIRARLIA